MEANVFDLINKEIEKNHREEIVTLDYHIEAYQIVRIKKMTVGSPKREVVDTIYVRHGNVELAKERALCKANAIGNCMVVEKSEKIVESYGSSR